MKKTQRGVPMEERKDIRSLDIPWWIGGAETDEPEKRTGKTRPALRKK